MIYKFYLTVGSSVTEVFPLNFLESSLVDEQENDQIFYRRKFNGVLTFVNNNGDDDFNLLYGIDQSTPCEKLPFSITRSGVAYWDGYFSTTDGKFDADKCTFEVTPLPDDDYQDLMEKQDDQYNILSIPIGDAPLVTVKIYGTTTQFTRNRFLLDVIEYIADQMMPGITVSSDFFTEATNPVTLHANHLLYLTIAQKSDIIRPTSTDAATVANISWKELMDILWAMWQVKWDYIPGTSTINIEHISWWSRSAGLDLRSQLISKASNKYNYLKGEMPKYEKLTFLEAFNGNFVGVPIWYDSKCVDQNADSNTKEITIPVTTDIQYILDTPEEISDEGFVIMCNYLEDGSYYIESDEGYLVSGSSLNMHLSVASLQHYYFRHNRVLIEGYLNNVLTTFWNAKKTITQDTYAIVCPSDNFDASKTITTELGHDYLGDGTDPGNIPASVRRSDLNPNGQMKLSLVYGPGDNTNTGVDDLRIITITEVKGTLQSRFYASLNRPADADLVITMYLTCEDGDAAQCDTDVATMTILTGTRNAFVIVPWCEPVATPATCVDSYHPDVTGAPGWTVNFIYDEDSYC